jgi:hypothetical protein
MGWAWHVGVGLAEVLSVGFDGLVDVITDLAGFNRAIGCIQVHDAHDLYDLIFYRSPKNSFAGGGVN